MACSKEIFLRLLVERRTDVSQKAQRQL